MENVKSRLIQYARSLGFERFGVTSARPLAREEQFLKNWLAQGRAGEMDYLEREPHRRSRPAELLPGAKSVIALAMDYSVASPQPSPAGRERRSTGEADLPEGRIARYARGRDYHKLIGKKLEAFTRYLAALAPEAEYRTFVDTGPLLERAFAQRAGIGFVGKNTMVITKGLGSWVFLASVVTTLDLPSDAPEERSCGQCRLCIDACPTQAITAPYELDARRCISYLTIEHDGPIDQDLRGKTGEWVFGCDICQEVCPHNKLPLPSPPLRLRRVRQDVVAERERSESRDGFVRLANQHHPSSQPSPLKGEGALWVTLAGILSIHDDQEFHHRFAGTPLTRAGRASLVRNACLAAANLSRTDLTPQLQRLAQDDPHPIVREHAAWALSHLAP